MLLRGRKCFVAFACVVVVVFSGSGCRDRASSTAAAPFGEAPPIVAQVGSNVITTEALQKEMARRGRAAGKRIQSAAELEAVLEEMIRFETIFARAAAAGYDQDPEMQQRFRRMVVAKYQEDRLPGGDHAVVPKDAEIAASYQRQIAEFTQPGKVRVAMIFQKVSAKAAEEKQAEAWQRAGQLRELAVREATQQAGFGDLARQHSDDAATRYQGGNCGWVDRGKTDYPWPQPVVDAMFALAKPGDISPVVRAADGLYLLRLIEAREPAPLPLEKVRDRIAWQLGKQAAETRRQEFYARQKEGLSIKVNREELAKLISQAQAAAPEVAGPPPLPRR